MFMQPQIVRGGFVLVRDANGEETVMPEDVYDPRDHGEHDASPSDGWFARLSASGYMDCTDWCGPYATEEEAAREMADTWFSDCDCDACENCETYADLMAVRS